MTETEIINLFRSATKRQDLLFLLNQIKKDELGDKAYPFTLGQLNYFCNSSHTGKHYEIFSIPKKSGGVRQICAPHHMLKSLLSCVNALLQAVYSPTLSATGFIPGRSVVDNAAMHIGKLYVFNSDLKDFFPSISKYRVRAALIAKPICASDEIADALANLCCAKMPFRDGEFLRSLDKRLYDNCEDVEYRDFLPQGSPASPAMTNIICRHMDWQMEHLARKFGCTYSRYADDMTFSCNRSIFSLRGDFYREFSEIVRQNGFTINEAKTRVQKKGCRQEVTGLTVGEKVNVSKAYIRDLTNILHIWEKYGYTDAASKYACFHNNTPRPFTKINSPMVNLEIIIRGKINYLKMVKGADDSVYIRLKTKFDSLTGKTGLLKSACYTYSTVLKIPQFETLMKCHVTFDQKTRIFKGKEFEYIFGKMVIYGKTELSYIGRNTYARLKAKYGNLTSKLLSDLKDRLFICRCCNAISHNEFWLITDFKPYHNTSHDDSLYDNYMSLESIEKYLSKWE